MESDDQAASFDDSSSFNVDFNLDISGASKVSIEENQGVFLLKRLQQLKVKVINFFFHTLNNIVELF